MTEPTSQRHPVTTKRLRHAVPGAEHVRVRKDVPLGDAGLRVDLYEPDSPARPRPWVLFVNGLPDPGAERLLGCAVKDMASYESWGRAVAASGLVGVTHATGNDPAVDLQRAWADLRTHGPELGLARGEGSIWACSSHVPNGLGLLLNAAPPPRSAAFCYGFMLDLDGAEGVAEAQRAWRFANPAAGRGIGDLARVPTLVVRAGRDDTPHVNASIDAFARHALAVNFPITVVNYAEGGHAFDLEDDGPAAAAVVSQVLTFLGTHAAAEDLTRGTTGSRSV